MTKFAVRGQVHVASAKLRMGSLFQHKSRVGALKLYAISEITELA